MHAGIPTPSKAAPQIARPDTAATDDRIRATRSTWPTAYCGSPPPHRVTSASTGSTAIPSSSPSSWRASDDEFGVAALQHLGFAGPAHRRAEQHAATGLERPLLRRDGDAFDGQPLASADEQAAARRQVELRRRPKSRSPPKPCRSRPGRAQRPEPPRPASGPLSPAALPPPPDRSAACTPTAPHHTRARSLPRRDAASAR